MQVFRAPLSPLVARPSQLLSRGQNPKMSESAPEPAIPVNPDPVRVLVQEVPAPGQTATLKSSAFDDARSIAAARRSRPGGYLKLPLAAVKELGKKAVLLSKVFNGTDLILRVRLFPIPQPVR